MSFAPAGAPGPSARPAALPSPPIAAHPGGAGASATSTRRPLPPGVEPRLSGVRPWVGGISLLSTGVSTLDKLLGGGVPRGSVVVLEEDAHATHAVSLAQAFLGAGVHCGHSTVVAGADAWLPLSHYATTVPDVRTSASADVSEEARAGSAATTTSAPAAPANPDDGLRIAWQYRKYADGPAGTATGTTVGRPSEPAGSLGLGRGTVGVPGARLGTHALASSFAPAGAALGMPGAGLAGSAGSGAGSGGHRMSGSGGGVDRAFCPALDMSKHVDASAITSVVTLEAGAAGSGGAAAAPLEAFLASIKAAVDAAVADADVGDPRSVVRLAVLSAGSPAWPTGSDVSSDAGSDARELVRFLHGVRALCRRSRCTCFVTVPSRGLGASVVRRVEHVSDIALEVTAFDDGSGAAATEFDGYAGMLVLRRHHHMNALSSAAAMAAADTTSFLFKRGRRRFQVEKLHLPPEQSRSFQPSSGPSSKGSAGGGAKVKRDGGGGRSKPALRAGMACATSFTESGDGSLDF